MGKNKSDSILKLGIILFVITAIAVALLSYVNEITKEPIARQKEIATQKALNNVLPGDGEFELLDSDLSNEDIIGKIYKSDNGYVFIVYPKGYGGEIELFVGIDNNSKVSGIEITSHTETPGLGANATNQEFKDQYKDKSAENIIEVKKGATTKDEPEISALTGATITSRAITKGVNSATGYYSKILKEGKK